MATGCCRYSLLSPSSTWAPPHPPAYQTMILGSRWKRAMVLTAAKEEDGVGATEKPLSSAEERTSSGSGGSGSSSKKKNDEGRGTALFTGGIAVLLGVGYLVLVQLLEMRGASLEPPPPEAYGP